MSDLRYFITGRRTIHRDCAIYLGVLPRLSSVPRPEGHLILDDNRGGGFGTIAGALNRAYVLFQKCIIVRRRQADGKRFLAWEAEPLETIQQYDLDPRIHEIYRVDGDVAYVPNLYDAFSLADKLNADDAHSRGEHAIWGMGGMMLNSLPQMLDVVTYRFKPALTFQVPFRKADYRPGDLIRVLSSDLYLEVVHVVKKGGALRMMPYLFPNQTVYDWFDRLRTTDLMEPALIDIECPRFVKAMLS